MEKFVEQTLLYDFYGELLTERQRQVYESVVLDDCSLSEVAEELSISRQGVMLAITLYAGSRIAGYHGVIAAQAVADLLTAILAIVLFIVLLPELRGSRRKTV